jgi:hypothetical protein
MIDEQKKEETQIITEWGGVLRCFNSKGDIINIADELNRMEKIKMSCPEKQEN